MEPSAASQEEKQHEIAGLKERVGGLETKLNSLNETLLLELEIKIVSLQLEHKKELEFIKAGIETKLELLSGSQASADGASSDIADKKRHLDHDSLSNNGTLEQDEPVYSKKTLNCAEKDGSQDVMTDFANALQDPSSSLAESGNERGFSDTLGAVPMDEERNMSSRLKSIESFISPLRDQVVMEQGRPRFLNIAAAVADDEMVDLEADIYSILFLSTPCSLPFFFTIMISICQYYISFLIVFDLLKAQGLPYDVENENPFKVPAKVGWQVVCAQFASLIIAFVSESDIITSAKMVIIGYDPDIKSANPGASHAKLILANTLRFLEGLTTIFISILIIIRSSDVLEIFKDFAAVAFISELDNIAFEIAKDGLVGQRLKAATERVEETKMKVQKRERSWMISLGYFLLFIPFLVGLLFVRVRQNNGYVLAGSSCKNLDVKFGDELYEIPADAKFMFDGEGENKTFPGSTRPLPFMNETPPVLLYQYFSGQYVAEQQETFYDRLEEHNSRPIYWENNFVDPTSGKFYFCNRIKSWVFTIEALIDSGAVPKKSLEECEWGWLMLSPITEAMTLDEAPKKDWKVWTGAVVDLGDSNTFKIECTDCERDIDCGFNHGQCNQDSKTCHCNEDWQGIKCDVPRRLCPHLGFILYGESAYDYFENRNYQIFDQDFTMYNRPIYLGSTFGYPDEVEVIIYTGRRWFDTLWASDDFAKVHNNFHAYWDDVLQRTTYWYSDFTDSILPTGIEWYEIASLSEGFGPFGYSYKIEARYECLHVDCHDNLVCGLFGRCVEGADYSLFDSEYFTRDNCECFDGYGGFYCEHDPCGPYAKDMYEEYRANSTFFVENNKNLFANVTNMTYLKFWENETLLDECSDF